MGKVTEARRLIMRYIRRYGLCTISVKGSATLLLIRKARIQKGKLEILDAHSYQWAVLEGFEAVVSLETAP